MNIHHNIKMWFRQKLWGKPQHPHEHEEDTMAVPEVHTGKVAPHPEETQPHHEAIYYDNVAIPEVHIPHKK